MECPECQNELKVKGRHYTCPACGVEFNVSFTCQVCGSVPEELAACGSVGYFCNSCNALRSRTAMNKKFAVIDTTS